MAQHNFPFNIAQVCELEGIRVPFDGRANYTAVCPVCGKRSLSISFQKDNFRCFNCEAHGGVLQLYVLCENRVDMTLSDARKDIMERLYGYSDANSAEQRKEIRRKMEQREKEIKESEVPQSKLRNADELDATNSELLNLLDLANDHLENLLGRGLSKATISTRRYKTYPISSFEEYPLKLMEEGLYVEGVPGFYRNDSGKWTLAQVKRGIVIPIMSHHNKIQGFQIRKDDSLLSKWYKKDNEGKYILNDKGERILEKEKKFSWLSSKGRKDGVGVNGFIHYACDFSFESGVFVPQVPPNKGILLTEGPLKGDIFYEKTSYPAMCVPGVSCQYQLSQELDFLKKNGFEVIYNAYDMDYMTNPKVYTALKASYELILSKGFKLYRLMWNPDKKGIDDYYAWKIK